MNNIPNTVSPMHQTESRATMYGNNALVDPANAEGSSAPQLDLDALPSTPSIQTAYDSSTIDPLDIHQPLPETWCSMPQTTLRPDLYTDGAMAGNYGSASSDGALRFERPLAMSERDLPGSLVASAQDQGRSYACVFVQHSSGHLMSPRYGRGHLKFVNTRAEYQRWLELANLRGPSPQAIPMSNGFGNFQPNTTQFSSSVSHQGPPFVPQPAYPDPQTLISASSISPPAHLPSPRFHQDPVQFPRSSHPGPSDSRCAPAATSIPVAPHYQSAFSSLSPPPPPIARKMNLDSSGTAAVANGMYQYGVRSADDRVHIPFNPRPQLPGDNTTPPASAPQLIAPNRGTAPGYQAQDDPPPEARTHWQVGDNGRGRS